MRINKYLADAGVGSRRAVEKLIGEGKVKINGAVAVLGADVSESDSVTLENKQVKAKTKSYYIMLHKPKGYVTTVNDELGRKTVMDLVPVKAARLFPVGRLDYDTEGLLILTNDGSLANMLTHPSHKVTKTYVARVSGMVREPELQALRQGVVINGVKTNPAGVRILEGDVHTTKLEIIISEGKNHQIKKMFEAVGKPVEFLKRTAIGEIRLGGLSRGACRDLSAKELAYLKTIE